LALISGRFYGFMMLATQWHGPLISALQGLGAGLHVLQMVRIAGRPPQTNHAAERLDEIEMVAIAVAFRMRRDHP
jgi:hypothetical protein